MAGCGFMDCKVSTGICGRLTFGRGKLDNNGYWEHPCSQCAEEWEKRHPEDAGDCWPSKGDDDDEGLLYDDDGVG